MSAKINRQPEEGIFMSQTFTCKYCKISFEKDMSKRSPLRGDYQFCSVSCRNKSRSNPDKKQEFICQECGKTFIEWAYRTPTHCSKRCASHSSKGHPKPTLRVDAFHVIQSCQNCGKDYQTNRIQVALRAGKFCSKDCKYAARSLAMRGDKNKLWRGGQLPGYRGENWHSQSRKARKRDSYTCQDCGKRYGETRTDVHHIKPYRDFNGDFESANRLENLIVLCRQCHVDIEHGKRPCPVPKNA
jgi:hypothetical protein